MIAALGFCAGAQAQVFKCVDAGGKTVYSQSPCPSGAKSSTIAKPSAAPAPAPSAADKADKKGDPKAAAKSGPMTAAEREADFRKRQQEKEAADKKAAEQSSQSAQMQENCARAKEQYATYDAGGRISRLNPNGERYYLSDEQVAQEKVKAQANVTQYCK